MSAVGTPDVELTWCALLVFLLKRDCGVNRELSRRTVPVLIPAQGAPVSKNVVEESTRELWQVEVKETAV